jgi:hypothetical protein
MNDITLLIMMTMVSVLGFAGASNVHEERPWTKVLLLAGFLASLIYLGLVTFNGLSVRAHLSTGVAALWFLMLFLLIGGWYVLLMRRVRAR